MDRRLLFSNDLDSDNKLIRAASFSELSSNKITYEQRLQSEACGELVRQYSCEEVFNKESNTRQLIMSQSLKSDKQKLLGTWKYTLPRQSSLKECEWPSISNKTCSIQKQLSVPIQYMSRANSDMSNSRSILAPPKLIIDKNNLYQSKSTQILSNDGPTETTGNFNMLSLLDKTSTLDNQEDNLINNPSFTKQDTVTDNNSADESFKEKVTFIQENITSVKLKPKQEISELKKKLRSLVKKNPKKSSKIFTTWSIVFSILLPIAVINLAFFLHNVDISNDFCNPTLKIHKGTEEFKTRIYGQDEAIDKLIKYFKSKENWTGFDIVAFVGGTGVGKSHTFEIMKNSLKDTNNFLDFFPPVYKKGDQAYALLSACRCNFIRLENLKLEDVPDIIHFSNDLRKRIKNYCVVILAIVNPQVTNNNLKKTLDLEKSVSLIEEKLKEADFHPTVIGFRSINDKALMNCIKDAADYANMELSIEESERVMRDLLTTDSGCKGAYAKVQVAGKKKQVFS